MPDAARTEPRTQALYRQDTRTHMGRAWEGRACFWYPRTFRALVMQVIGHPRRHHLITVSWFTRTESGGAGSTTGTGTADEHRAADRTTAATVHPEQLSGTGVSCVSTEVALATSTGLSALQSPHVAHGASQAGLVQACCSIPVHTCASGSLPRSSACHSTSPCSASFHHLPPREQ